MIEFRGVTVVYRRFPERSVRAVDDLSLTINAGEILGIAGPNGAGKTTLISVLLGFIRATRGEATVFGRSPRDYIETHGVSYLPELLAINREWRLTEALKRFGLMEGMDTEKIRERTDAVITQLGLDEHRRKRVRELSKGTLQRLGLAQALLQEHDLMVLDEPTHGLDPVWTYRFRDFVQALKKPGRAILIASHNLDELQRLADRVAFVDKGRVQRVVDLREQGAGVSAPVRYRLELTSGGHFIAEVFPNAEAVSANAFMVPEMDIAAMNASLAQLISRGALVSSITPERAALEQHFLETVNR